MYDYVIVGSGLFGCVFAHEMHKAGRQCLVLERRDQVGGNVYCEEKDGIHIHRYGAHIFHTSDLRVWEYVNQFAKFNHFINTPVASNGLEEISCFSEKNSGNGPNKDEIVLTRILKEVAW